ncbi:MAG: twin-arginine translocase TatA/TatE family subunit [Actinomycetota bacterium]|nr:twin-arginine translocase TatA/TatE family subunit [Actinomycetota bacterium]
MGIGSFGGTELIIALLIILLLFGAKRIPELAKGLGSGVREFRKGTRDDYEVEEENKEGKSEELAAGEADRAEQKPS